MSAELPQLRILVLDGNANDRDLAFELLRTGMEGAELECARSIEEFVSRLGGREFDLIVVDIALATGLRAQLSATGQRCPFIVLESPDSGRGVRETLGYGAFCVLEKDSGGFLQLVAMAQRALERSAAPARAEDGLVERLPVGVLAVGLDGRVRRANRGAAESLGISESSEALGLPLVDLLASHPAQRRLEAFLDGQHDSLDLEAGLRRPDGENRWVRLRLWPSEDQEGLFEGTLENISEYKQTEAELGRQAAELGRSNAELEQFAYVVSHDLQEPLGLIQRYAELIAESGSIDEQNEASRHLGQVLSSSRRMQSMIDGILEYSRIETKGRPFDSVSLEEVVGEAVANLARAIEKSGAEIKYRSLPTLKADRGQMLQLFQNLIGNAIKFRADDRRPRVVVSATEQRESWRVTVQDNGIGIEPRHRDCIFGMFQRLHSGEDYPGTGIGLSICRGIVRRHGGEIWVDSVPGEGAKFHLTISKSL